jgi:glycosidase
VAGSAAPGDRARAVDQARVTWDHLSGDVWAWEKEVSGRSTSCVVTALRVHGEEYEATGSGRSFSATVPLKAGENTVEALCDSSGERVAVAEVVYNVPLLATPTARIDISIDGGQVVLDSSSSTPNESSAAPVAGRYWSERAGNPASLVIEGGEPAGDGEVEGGTVQVTPPDTDGEYYVNLRAVDANGEEDRASIYFEVVDGQPRIPDYDVESPQWIDDAVVYGVIPRKFGEPALKGTTARLDYLKDMGVNTLWLSPVNTTIPYYSGYEVIDYFTIREDYGTEEDFRELVEEAHARDIRVLMDFVPNHTSELHRYYLDAEENGPQSVHWDLYDRDASGRATYYFGWTHLPNLDFDNPDVHRFMTEALSYWVREYDIDGYRADVAWGIKERRPDYWPELRRELKRIKPDVFLIAEASARDPYYVNNGFDGAYDWTDNLGEWAWHDVWSSPDGLVDRLDAALTNDGQGYDDNSRTFRFINNNDTGTRFVVEHGEGMTRVAAAMMFTLHGTPGPYTGDEFGADYHPYYDIEPLDWDEDPYNLRPYYNRLIELRHELDSLKTSNFERVDASPADKIYAYVRWGEDSTPVLVVLNYQDEAFQAELELPAQFEASGTVTDQLHDEQFTVSGDTLTVDMPAHTARIITP